MKFKGVLIAVLAAGLMAVSCGKEEAPAVKQMTTLDLIGSWQAVKIEYYLEGKKIASATPDVFINSGIPVPNIELTESTVSYGTDLLPYKIKDNRAVVDYSKLEFASEIKSYFICLGADRMIEQHMEYESASKLPPVIRKGGQFDAAVAYYTKIEM